MKMPLTRSGEPPLPPKVRSCVDGAAQATRICAGDKGVSVTSKGAPGTASPVVALTVAEYALGPMALKAATRT